MEEVILVCPNEVKSRILYECQQTSGLHSYKFMTKQEYIGHFLFSYDDSALFYLMKKYSFHIDVAKVILKSLYAIDLKKTYSSSKLEFLRKIKEDLKEQGYLNYSLGFLNFISKRKVEVQNYYDLDLYEEKALSFSLNVPKVSFSTSVYEFDSMEEEINFVCCQITKLLNQGIDVEKIFLCNVSSDYYYTIERIFSYYHIPVMIPYKRSIYSTKVVADFLETGELDLDNPVKEAINKKLISILDELASFSKDDPIYRKILIDKLKHTYIPTPKLKKAVQIKDLFSSTFSDSDYVFVIGFNQNVLPKIFSDTDYLSNADKEELEMYSTIEQNIRQKQVVIYLLSKIKHLFLSYKLSTPFTRYYPSSLIEELSLEVVHLKDEEYLYSDIYNKIRLAEKLDTFYLYGEKSYFLEELNTHYKIAYRTYTNRFSGISLDMYLKNLAYPLQISYTSLNSYNECKFQYYLKNVLKLDDFKDSFSVFVGSMYHKILSLYKKDNFNFEKEYSSYLKIRNLSMKEKLLLVRIKKELQEFIGVLKKQDLLTGYDMSLYEKKVEINLDKEVAVKFIGYIDKIMYYKEIGDTYFSIVDYKTGIIDTHIEPMKYGLHMQLPIYLYLIHYGKVFDNPIFTGIYYQNILFSYPSWSLKVLKERESRYMLTGYSTDDISSLSRFDSTYEESKVIKSLKYSDDKGFGFYSKVLDNDTLYKLLLYTKKHINEKVDSILEADFMIDPKIYDSSNVSCKFCSFRDICFMKEDNLVYLDKVEDLSFLGGDM